jgi:DNA-binding NtrC family response regulator
MSQTHDVETARPTKAVLIVDDEPRIVAVLTEAFEAFQHTHKYKIETARDGVDALTAILCDPFDLVVLDLHMPRMNGLEVLHDMRRLGVRTPVLVLTGSGGTASAADALGNGIFAYVPKPFDLPRLNHLVALALSPPQGDAPSPTAAS